MSVQRAVLDAALEIIAAEGPDAVSMREVARRAEVSHQAPYHHFEDRAGIFAAIAAEGFETLAAELRAVLADSPQPSRQCFAAYVRMAMEYRGHFRIMFRSDLCGISTHETTRIAADAAFSELLRMVERVIGRPSDDIESFTWATLIWSAAHGFATLMLDGPLLGKMPPGVTQTTLTDSFVELFSDMVDNQAAAIGFSPRR
ncbi:MAG: hypothetical protein RL119_1603 [Actinomycetota bacterium]